MKLIYDHDEYPMKFESLIIGIFSINNQIGQWKNMDPLEFANADSYGTLFINEDSQEFIEGKVILAAALGALAFQVKQKETLMKIRILILKFAKAKTQKDIMLLIDESINLVNSLI